MSVRIQYAYLKQQTWLYRRNYPKELQPMLGQAYKQSLKTGDARVGFLAPAVRFGGRKDALRWDGLARNGTCLPCSGR